MGTGPTAGSRPRELYLALEQQQQQRGVGRPQESLLALSWEVRSGCSLRSALCCDQVRRWRGQASPDCNLPSFGDCVSALLQCGHQKVSRCCCSFGVCFYVRATPIVSLCVFGPWCRCGRAAGIAGSHLPRCQAPPAASRPWQLKQQAACSQLAGRQQGWQQAQQPPAAGPATGRQVRQRYPAGGGCRRPAAATAVRGPHVQL